jgi:choline dehydrogenase
VPGHPANWSLSGELTAGLTVPVPRGRVVGGSSALNAGAFLRGLCPCLRGCRCTGSCTWRRPARRSRATWRSCRGRPRSAGSPAAPDRTPTSSPWASACRPQESRGRLTLDGADPNRAPRLEYRYLTSEFDRRRLREGVRLTVELLGTRAFGPLVAGRTGPPDDVLADDAALDRWIRTHLTSAIHLAGTARMGPEGDPGAVVDQRLRVRGVPGLRLVDTSVLPRVTSRGPAATAVMLGERAAELMIVDG